MIDIHSLKHEDDFKYYTKVEKGDKVRYFYSKDEYDAYLNKQKKGKLASVMDKVNSFLENFGKKTVNEIKSKTAEAKAFVDKISRDLKPLKPSLPGLLDPEKEWENIHERKSKYLYKEKLANGKTRYFYSEKEYQSYQKKLEYQNNEPEFMKHIKETSDLYDNKTPIRTEADDLKVTNDKYYTKDRSIKNREAYTVNCALAAAAYELRRRGYDVEAKPLPVGKNGYTVDEMDNWYENKKVIVHNSGTTIKIPFTNQTKRFGKDLDSDADIARVTKEILKNNPPGSRGNVSVGWKGLNSGHAMVYEVTESNDIIIRDPQTDSTRKLSDYKGRVSDMVTFRTDNLTLKPGITEVFNEK